MTDTNQNPSPEDANPGPVDDVETRGIPDITLEPGIPNPNDAPLPEENPDPHAEQMPDAEETPKRSR